ncbi:MAG: hypothetical protein AAFN10_15205 [Bacteroidota bacterium]
MAKRTKDRDNSKLLSRGLPKGMAVFVIFGLSIMLIGVLIGQPISLSEVNWANPLDWWPLALVIILVAVILIISRVFFPLRWNAENGLLYQPLRYIPIQLVGLIVWGLIGYLGICCAIYISGLADIGIRIVGGAFGLFGAVAALYYLYYIIRRIWQYVHFGNSSLAIRPSVPRLGAEINVKLIEQKLDRFSPEVDIAFRHISEKVVTEGKKANKSQRMGRIVKYEQLETTNIEQLTGAGILLQIPAEGVEATDYDPIYPHYWELMVSKADVDYEARFLIYVDA